ncbi:MAG: hypothetical protein WA058_03025 [Minisyncoccia bacterium]
MSKPVLVPDPDFLERAIKSFSLHGDKEMLTIIDATRRKLQANLTRFERIYPNKPIGDNLAILQFRAVLAKVGFGDSP